MAHAQADGNTRNPLSDHLRRHRMLLKREAEAERIGFGFLNSVDSRAA